MDGATQPIMRKAAFSEGNWVNARYAEIGFVSSDLDNEIVAIAEFRGKRAGLGRLVRVDQDNEELGGMYVLPEFRGSGIAKEIVSFLLKHRNPTRRLFCLPFAHLAQFYSSFGFQPVSDGRVPEEIRKKHRWCNETYPRETLLFAIEASATHRA